MWLFLARKQSKSDENININKSMASKWPGVIPSVKTTGSAKTIQILKILLPIILPTRRSDLFCLAAVIVVTSSGKDVPIAIMVRDMMRSESPILVAILEAELTTS